ncbi:hypothetical protein SMULJ23_0178 [Streptococcus mutans LJ23]|nr:hypothetical protein SMULJ23_0178 [Streptococcus mutans LJ23]
MQMVCHNEERLPLTPSCLAYEAVNNKYHHPINMEKSIQIFLIG